MAVTLVTQPNRIVQGIDTRAHAALSQLPFQFLRADWNVISVGARSGEVLVSIAGNHLTQFVVGDQVYVSPLLDAGDVVRFAGDAVFSVSYVDYVNPNTRIQLSGTVGGSAFTITQGYTNLLTGTRADYKLRVWAIPATTGGTGNLTDFFFYQSANNGDIFIDWSDIARGFLATLNVLSFQFRLRYQEYYNGIDQGATATTNDMQVLNARKQIKSEGGVAMWDNLLAGGLLNNFSGALDQGGNVYLNLSSSYGNVTANYPAAKIIYVQWAAGVTIYNSGFYEVLSSAFVGAFNTRVEIDLSFQAGAPNGGTAYPRIVARLLTKFRNPKVWKGWGTTISALRDSQLTVRNGNDTAIARMQPTDINKVVISGTITQNGSITAGTGVTSWIIGRELNASQEYINLRVERNDFAVVYSETLYFRVQEPCSNPVMIEWRNSLGANDQWMFSIEQTVTNEAEEGVLFNRPIIVPYDQAEDVIGRKVEETRESILLTAEGLLIDQLRAIMEIKSSDYVYVWLDNQGVHRVRVRCTDLLQTGYSTKGKLFSIQIQLEMPPNFNLFEDVLYEITDQVI